MSSLRFIRRQRRAAHALKRIIFSFMIYNLFFIRCQEIVTNIPCVAQTQDVNMSGKAKNPRETLEGGRIENFDAEKRPT